MNRDKIRRATIQSAGYDITSDQDFTVKPNEVIEIKIDELRLTDDMKIFTSFLTVDPLRLDRQIEAYLEIKHWFAMICPRSGLGTKYGLRFLNTIGIADQDYRGSMTFTMTADKELHIKEGERFAQMIFIPRGIWSNEITPTIERGENGYGSTGLKQL